jgi:tRNA nucleotidyltransferase/poly(A) polymerase
MASGESIAVNTIAITWTDSMRRVLTEVQQRQLLHRVLVFAEQCGVELYAVGGAPRDICLGRPAEDVDLTMLGDSMGFAQGVASHLGAAYVPMDAVRGEARVVYHKRHVLDFAQCKGDNIIADLQHRDFTINAMACPLATLLTRDAPAFLDPHGGWEDLGARRIRMVSPVSFIEDPLRLLRALRFAATLDFRLDPATHAAMEAVVPRLRATAAERIHSELLKLFAAPLSSPHILTMVGLGLLDNLFPELAAIRGIPCGPGRPLDLLAHSIRTYQAVEALINDPGAHLPTIAEAVSQYFQVEERQALVKWAALLHAVGKAVEAPEASQELAITCGHAVLSALQWEHTGSRLKLSRKQIDFVKTLIAQNGRALELPILEAQGRVTLRFMHGWCKELRDSMLGVFVLALGHSLAAGSESLAGHSTVALAQLAARIWDVYRRRILPVITGPRLVTGHDLQQIFHLSPGPRFKSLLNELEIAQVEGQIRTRAEALQWVGARLL